MPAERLLSARDVILEVVNNMREGIEPLGSLKALRDGLRERVSRQQA